MQIMDLLYEISVAETACVVCTSATADLIHDYMSRFLRSALGIVLHFVHLCTCVVL